MAHVPYGPYEKYIKRPLDCVLASSALVLLSPALLLTAIMVKKNMGTPVLFSQNRPGRIDPVTKNEKIFKLYKFRTMTDERDEKGELLSDSIRLTPFGRFLRSTSLDELPELINIAKGDMAIVGPRPLLVRYLPAYTEEEKHRHDVRPGLTGLAQVSGRNYVPWDERLAYDIDYVKKITFLGDLSIIIKTVIGVLKHSDVAVDTEVIDEGYLDEIRGVEYGKNDVKGIFS